VLVLPSSELSVQPEPAVRSSEFLTYLRQTHTTSSSYELASEVWGIPASGIRVRQYERPVPPRI